MFLRFAGPKDAKITIYRGFDAGQTLDLPCTVGFRPGYSYRLAVWDIPALPRQVFCPSLEVRGTLALIPKLRNADFPAHIHFTEDEFRKAFTGSLIKKIITLERPDLAIPIATLPDAPLELNVEGSRDPLIEAAQHGQPLVVFQMGQRLLTPQELNSLAVPGTVLLPGDRVLGTPRVPPWVVWNWHPVYDPVYGPRNQAEFMHGFMTAAMSAPPAGSIATLGKLKGLDPTDTIAEYLNSRERNAAQSPGDQANRVALLRRRPASSSTRAKPRSSHRSARQTLESNAITSNTPSTSIGQLARRNKRNSSTRKAWDTRAICVLERQPTASSDDIGVRPDERRRDIKTTLRNPTESVDRRPP